MSELKPCPFCGIELERKKLYWKHPDNDCFLAYADSEFENIVVCDDDVEAWNRRAEDV